MIELQDTLKFRWPLKIGDKITRWPYSHMKDKCIFNEQSIQELPDEPDEVYERLILLLMVESRWLLYDLPPTRMRIQSDIEQYVYEYELEEKKYDRKFLKADWRFGWDNTYCCGIACKFYSYVSCIFYTKFGPCNQKVYTVKNKRCFVYGVNSIVDKKHTNKKSTVDQLDYFSFK